jgi:hypothetical protein
MTKAEQARLHAWRWKVLQHAQNGSRSVARTCRFFRIWTRLWDFGGLGRHGADAT